MPRSLVTGGLGFVGSNVALELSRLGHEVVALDNLHSGSEENLQGFSGEIVHHDISLPLSLKGRFDFIFHQAAITDPRHENDAETFQKNVDGFKQVIARAQQDKAKLIYASTAGLYGNGHVPMREDQFKDVLTVYGKSKLVMDEMAEKLFSSMHIVGLRYFNAYGPREAHKGRPASMVYHLWKQMHEGKRPRIFKWGEQKRDFIYVKDIVRANLAAMEGKSGVYNVGTGVASSFNDLVAALNVAMGTRFEPEYFDMPYDPKTYQTNTQADVQLAKTGIHFIAEWDLLRGVKDYVHFLSSK